MDSTSSNRPLTVGWGYLLSPLSLRAPAQPSYFFCVCERYSPLGRSASAPLPDFFLDFCGTSAPSGITFDTHGNLYLSQWGDYNSNEGAIYRISPDRSSTKWADGLGTPRRMVWSGGTAYGDYLYVTDATSKNISRVDLDGNVSTFASVSAMPHCLVLDRIGDYGGYMYTQQEARITLIALPLVEPLPCSVISQVR